MLEKADKIYKQLQTHRPVLENLLIQVIEHSTDRLGVRQAPAAVFTNGNTLYKLMFKSILSSRSSQCCLV